MRSAPDTTGDGPRTVDTGFSPALAGAREVVALVRRLADAHGRDDLVAELDGVAADLQVEAVPVLITGGAGQGKSSVLNALVGAPVSAVGGRSSTVVPIEVTHGASYAATVVSEPHPHRSGEVSDRALAFGDAVALGSGEFNPANERRLRVVAVNAPSTTLARGLVLVDTPPISDAWSAPATRALRAGAGAAAVVLVTSAAAPLSPGELDFLRVVGALSSRLIVVVNGTDAFSDWARVTEQDELLLEQRGISADVFAVDPTPYWTDRGGVPPGPDPGMQALAHHLEGVVLETEQQRISRALTETFWVADRLKMRLSAERAVIDSTTRIDDARNRLRVAAQAAHDLCGPDAGWLRLLQTRIEGLAGDLDADLAADLATLRADAARLADTAHATGDWADAFTQLHRQLAQMVAYRQRVLRFAVRACAREVTETFHHEWSVIVAATEIPPEAHAILNPRLSRAALSGSRRFGAIELAVDEASGADTIEAWVNAAERLVRHEMTSALRHAQRDVEARCRSRSLELHRSLVEVLTSLSLLGQLDPAAVTQRRRSLVSDLERLHTVDWSVAR